MHQISLQAIQRLAGYPSWRRFYDRETMRTQLEVVRDVMQSADVYKRQLSSRPKRRDLSVAFDFAFSSHLSSVATPARRRREGSAFALVLLSSEHLHRVTLAFLPSVSARAPAAVPLPVSYTHLELQPQPAHEIFFLIAVKYY